MAKRKGRTPKLDPAVSKAICDTVSAGVPEKYAALRAGIGERTLRDWKARGRKEKSGPYTAFLAALKKADADAVAVRVARIAKAGQGGQVIERTTITTTKPDGTTTTKTVEKHLPPQWTADAWHLERTHAGEFAANRKKDIEDAVAKYIRQAIENGVLAIPGPAGGKEGTAARPG